MTEVTAPPGIELVTDTVSDRVAGDTEITGWPIAFISSKWGASDQNRTSPRDAWGDVTIYKTQGGRYVVVRESLSLRYHASPTTCRMINDIPPGYAAYRKDLEAAADDLEVPECRPCPECLPPDQADLAEDEQVRYEWPKVQVTVCETSARAVAHLTRSRRGGSDHAQVSEPVRALLAEAARADPDWQRGERPMVRIS